MEFTDPATSGPAKEVSSMGPQSFQSSLHTPPELTEEKLSHEEERFHKFSHYKPVRISDARKSGLEQLLEDSETSRAPSLSASYRTSIWVGGNREAQECREKLRALELARTRRNSLVNPVVHKAVEQVRDGRRKSLPVVVGPDLEPRITPLQGKSSFLQSTVSVDKEISSQMVRRVCMSRDEAALRPLLQRMTSDLARRRQSSWNIPEDPSLPCILHFLAPADIPPSPAADKPPFPNFFSALSQHKPTLSPRSLSPTSSATSASPATEIASLYATPSSPRRSLSLFHPPSPRSPSRSRSGSFFPGPRTSMIDIFGDEKARMQQLRREELRTDSMILCQHCFDRDQTFKQIRKGLCERCGGDKSLDRSYWEGKG